MMNNKKLKYILFLLILLILISTVSLVVKSTREKQEIRKRAATPAGTATFSLEPQTSTVSPGQSLPVTIKFHTPTTPNDKGIVGIAAVLSYSFSGNNPLALNPENIQGKLSSPWNYVIKNVVTEGNTVTIQINAVYLQSGETGYTEATTPKEFATLNFTAQSEGNVTLSFNTEESRILAKNPINEDILSSNLPTGTYIISSEATPTLTPPPENTPTPTSTPTPTPTPPLGQVKIKFEVKFSGVKDKKPDQIVKVKIGRGETIIQELEQVNLNANNQGIYESQMIVLSSAITPGTNYYFLIKGPKHLQVRFCQNSGQVRPCTTGKITLNLGENILDFTGYPLPGGDLPPQDGVVNAIDAVALINCLFQNNSACLQKADLNFDGIINTMDINIMNNTIYSRWEDE